MDKWLRHDVVNNVTFLSLGVGGCVVHLKQQSNVVLSWSSVKHIGASCGDVKYVPFFVILHFQKLGKSPMFDAHFLFNWVRKNHHHTGVFLQRCVYYDQSSCLDASPRRCYKKYVNTWKRSLGGILLGLVFCLVVHH